MAAQRMLIKTVEQQRRQFPEYWLLVRIADINDFAIAPIAINHNNANNADPIANIGEQRFC